MSELKYEKDKICSVKKRAAGFLGTQSEIFPRRQQE